MRPPRSFAALLVLVPALSGARTEHNSFLERPASTPAAVANQLRDPRVLSRYERHFGKSKSALSTWFRGLHLMRLKETSRYVVYNADDQGVIRWKLLRLQAGTSVFADASGKPILKQSCGNPMASGTDVNQRPEVESDHPESEDTALMPQDDLAVDPTDAMTLAQPGVPELIDGAPLDLLGFGEPLVAAVPITATAALSDLSLAGLAALVPVFQGHGGGGIPRVTVPVLPPTLPPVQATPEPGTLLLMGGLAGVAARRRAQLRR